VQSNNHSSIVKQHSDTCFDTDYTDVSLTPASSDSGRAKRKRSQEVGRNRAASPDSPAELNGVGGDQCPMYSNSPHTMINGGESTDLPSSNQHSCESKPTTGEFLSRAAEPTEGPPKASEDVTIREHDQSGSDLAAKAPPTRRKVISRASENHQQTITSDDRNNEKQSQDSPHPSSSAPAPERIEKKIDFACSTRSALQLSPPISDSKDTPGEVIIKRSYAELGLGHVPLQFYPPQGDLSGEPFNPYVVRQTSSWERTLVVTKADVDRLAPMVEEMTKHIPSIDDNDLIERLRGVVRPLMR
jgi:hypothetical protein